MLGQSPAYKIISFNCEGVKSKLLYIQSLCEDADLIFLQETLLMPHKTNLFNNVHPDFNSYAVSSVECGSSILIGRPYGGLCILYRKHFTLIGNVINFEDKRLFGFVINCDNLKIFAYKCVPTTQEMKRT